MDPNTCLANFLDACRAGDRDGAMTALAFLSNWIATHGFLPKDPRIGLDDLLDEEMAASITEAASNLRKAAHVLRDIADSCDNVIKRTRA